jgi:serine/threonine protein kinase
MAPELILRKPYEFKVDIWSLGIIAYFLLTGEFPFYGDDIKALQKAIVNGIPKF